MLKNTQSDGFHIMIEGIDGSGKSTALQACYDWAQEKDIQIFNVLDYCQKEKKLPQPSDFYQYNGLFVNEPTFCWTGSAIRDEIITKHTEKYRQYSGWEASEAFALDRLILFKRIIIPFLKNQHQHIIFQDRGLLSTLAYQTLQDPHLSIDKLLNLSGNQTTLDWAPNIIFILNTPAKIALERLNKRTEKQDNAIFEKEAFLTKLAQQYLNPKIIEPFKKVNTKIIIINGTQSIPDVQNDIKNHLNQLINL